MSTLHLDLQSLYNLWSMGISHIGYIGHEGYRGTCESQKLHVNTINTLIRKKNCLRDELVDRINSGLDPSWNKTNKEYCDLCNRLSIIDKQAS